MENHNYEGERSSWQLSSLDYKIFLAGQTMLKNKYSFFPSKSNTSEHFFKSGFYFYFYYFVEKGYR